MHASPHTPGSFGCCPFYGGGSVVVDSCLLLLSLFVGVCVGSLFCYAVLSVLSSFVIILLRKRGRVELLYFNCLPVNFVALWRFLAMSWIFHENQTSMCLDQYQNEV